MKGSRPKPGRGRPVTGKAIPAAERMRRYRARRKAAGLKQIAAWILETGTPYSSHRLHDARSLAMHTVIAQKIDRNPALLQVAHNNLRRWTEQRGSLPPALEEWRALLASPWPRIAALLCEQSERAIRLRQSTPFAGVLTPTERRRIHDAIRA